jgi:hypothetical protein
VEVLRRDFLLNLSGLEQSFQYYFDDGVNEYLKRVLLPELEGINGLPIEFLQASEQSSVISMRLHQIAVEESSIQQVLDRYFECFGHLPLDSQFGVGAVVENWSALGEGRCVEPEELWAWAEGRNSPLARFHVCQILCARLGSLSESTARRFWTEVNSIVLAGTSAESDGTEGSEQWVLYYLLAQHYCRLIELQNWCSRGEVVASIASWLADRVTTTFIENDGDIENVLPQLQEIYFSRVFDQWAVIRPAVEPSLFRYVTINVRNAWGLALLGHLGRVSQGDEAIIQELGKSEVMLKALVGNLWHAYPFGQEDEPIYAFTPMSILSLSEKLAELDSEEYSVQLNKFMLGRISEISDVKVLCEKLLNLDTENETDSAILFHGLTYLLSTERKSLDLLGSALDSIQEWSKAALLGLPTEHMDTVFEGLCELLGKGDPVRLNRPSWFYELPHVICEACMDSVEDEKKRRTLFFMLLTVCVKTDTVSALERIMQSEVRSSLADEISQWKRKFEHICIYGSSAVAARLRGVLCALDR